MYDFIIGDKCTVIRKHIPCSNVARCSCTLYIFEGFFSYGGGCFCFISLILRPIVYCALALNALICTISDHKLRNTCIPLVQLIVENKFESTFKCPG